MAVKCKIEDLVIVVNDKSPSKEKREITFKLTAEDKADAKSLMEQTVTLPFHSYQTVDHIKEYCLAKAEEEFNIKQIKDTFKAATEFERTALEVKQ